MRGLWVLMCLWLMGCAFETNSKAKETLTVTASGVPMRLTGRSHAHADGSITFGYPSVSLELVISGGTLSMDAYSSSGENQLALGLNDKPPIRITPGSTMQTIILTDSPEPQRIRISHLGETWHGIVTIADFSLTGGEFLPPPSPRERKLLVIGDSVSCGEAVERTPDCSKNNSWWNPDQSWGMLLAQGLKADAHLVCYGGRGLTRSWNGNTDELQAPAFSHLAIATEDGPHWDHSLYQPGLILISLGTNDFSLGIGPLPEREDFVERYTAFVRQLLMHYPKADIVLTEGAIVNDMADSNRPQKTRLREYISATLASVDSNRVHQIHAQHYPGDSCDAHPTGEQHRAMAKDILNDLQTITGWH